MDRNKANSKGFTLIELLIVIGIIGFLAAAILVAVDPVKRIQDARNAKRWAEVNGILNAMLTKQVDNRNYYEGEDDAPVLWSATKPQVIVSDIAGVTCVAPAASMPSCGAVVLATHASDKVCVANLSGLVSEFIAELPIDPIGDGEDPDPTGIGPALHSDLGVGNTGYYIQQTSLHGRIEIGACWPDQDAVIKVKR